ncbi:PLDc N-terminal domain-containing protein, partial [Streptococcus suis]
MLLLLQIVFLAEAYIWLDQYRTWFFVIERLLSLVAIFHLINGEMDALSRVTWLILIMIAPLLGSALLLYTRLDLGYRGLQRRIDVVTEESAQFLQTKPE